MNSTFVKIYDIVSQIPAGKVATYGQIAVLAGLPRGARVVGWAMRVVPEDWARCLAANPVWLDRR